ncbi:hypothetical protein Tco_0980375 [Tanacetum coccineum]
MPSFDATDSFVAAAHGLAEAESMMPNGVLLGLWTQIGWLMLLRCRRFFRCRYPWRARWNREEAFCVLAWQLTKVAAMADMPSINFSGGGFCEAAIAEGLAEVLMTNGPRRLQGELISQGQIGRKFSPKHAGATIAGRHPPESLSKYECRLQLKKMTRLMGVEGTSGEVATAKARPQSASAWLRLRFGAIAALAHHPPPCLVGCSCVLFGLVAACVMPGAYLVWLADLHALAVLRVCVFGAGSLISAPALLGLFFLRLCAFALLFAAVALLVFLLRCVAVWPPIVHDFGFFRYDPAAIQFLSYEEIPLAPEAACVGLEIRVVGNDSGEKVRQTSN